MIGTAELAWAADENLAAHFTYAQRRVDGMRVREDERLVLTDSGLPCDTFNAVCRARLTVENAVPSIRDAIAWFSEAGRPFSWWVGPGDEPSNLGAFLEAEGLVPAETELAMAADLGSATLAGPWPAGLEVRQVRTASDLAHFARISAANWIPPDPDVVRFYDLASAVLLAPESPLRFYLGLLDGEPVAASEMTLAGGVAGLYNISTLEAHRGLGVGTALTMWPLREAMAEGVGTAVLQAAPAGVSIYRRIGFAPYGDIAEYKPALPASDEAAA